MKNLLRLAEGQRLLRWTRMGLARAREARPSGAAFGSPSSDRPVACMSIWAV